MRHTTGPFLVACLLCAGLWSPRAGAQNINDRITTPPTGMAAGSAAYMLGWNPAAMTLNNSWEIDYFHSEVAGSQTLLPGKGDAIYATTPVFGPLHVGMGFEFVEPPRLYRAEHNAHGLTNGGWVMGTFSLAVDMAGFASLGTSVRTWIAPGDHEHMHGLLAWDVSLAIHSCRYWSLFAAVYDINSPSKGGQRPVVVERTWAVGLAVRPLGRDQLTISVDNLVGEVTRNDTLRLGIEWEPVRGIGIMANASLLFGDDWPMGQSSRRADLQDVVVSVGLRLDLAHVGLWSAFNVSTMTPARDQGYWGSPLVGWSVGLRISGQSHATVMKPKRYVTLRIEGKQGPRDVVGHVMRLERLLRDDGVEGVVIEPLRFHASAGQVQDMREVVDDLQAAGKHVVCHMDEASSSAYYLCSAADLVYLGPAGGIRLSGYKTRLVYYTGLLQKLGVNVQIVRIGPYKSYPEQLTLEGPSDPALEEHRELLEDVWHRVVEDIAAGRGMEPDALEELLAQGPFNSEQAVTHGLADAIAYADEIETMIEEELDDKIILDRKYWKSAKKPQVLGSGPGRVAIVTLAGGIVEGKSRSFPLLGMRTMGDETIVKALDRVRKDHTVSAVVLRVDSGGGSSLASERIWRAVQRLAEKKPVVASMGGIAASGGYYVLAPSTEIWANPSTLTGSIGIYYGKADLSGTLEKLGIGVTVLEEGGDRADMESWHRPYTPEEVAFLEEQLGYFYNLFLARVAAGRGMTKEEVDDVGQGRVWSGTRATEIGLVDREGGLVRAVDRARELGGVPDWVPVVDMSPSGGLLEQILGKLGGAKQGPEQMEIAAMIARATGLAAVFPHAYLMLMADETPLALHPFSVEL